MIHRYGWFNPTTNKWHVGDKEELNYLRNQLNVIIIEVEAEWCKTKKATKKFENSILNKNK